MISSTLLALAVLSAGCGRMPTGDDSSATSGPSHGTLTGAESLENPSARSSSGDEDSSFGFDDIASYDDGVEVEIVGTVAQQATTGMTGAETTHGQMVVASVLIRNGSVTAVDAASVLVTATYGADDTDARWWSIRPGAGERLPRRVTAGEEATAGCGFAIPFTRSTASPSPSTWGTVSTSR